MPRQHPAVSLLFVLVLLGHAAIAAVRVEPVTIPPPRASHPCVYIDRSHDWMFAYDDLADRMLAPTGFDAVLSDASLTAVGPLDRFAVVVVQQLSWPTLVSCDETTLLKNYVRQGGRLVLITKPEMPLEALAQEFGFRLRAGGAAPLQAAGPLVENGSPRSVPTRAVRFHLQRSPAHTVLIEDGNGDPVVAAVNVGQGRVVVWADDHAYWDFCAQRDKHTGEVASAPTTTALFQWLVDGTAAKTKGRTPRVFAENVDQRGALIFRYALPVASPAQEMIERVPAVLKVVKKWNGLGPPVDQPFTIHWLAAGGGGWAGPRGAGVCVFGADPAYPIKVMGHELTHSASGNLTRAFGEAWAVIVGVRSAAALGYVESARKEIDANLAQLKREDPTLRKLDLMDSMRGPMNHAYQRKALWLMLQLEKRYGSDFMSRFLALRNHKYGLRTPIDLQQVFELFAETSGDPGIWKRFAACGTSVKPRSK